MGDRPSPQRRAAGADYGCCCCRDGGRGVAARCRRVLLPEQVRDGMNVVLNGHSHQLEDGATAREAVSATGARSEGRGVAVALDGEVVPRARWDDVPLREGVKIE